MYVCLCLSPCGPLLLTNYGFLHILFLSRALFREIPAGIKRTSSSKEERSIFLRYFPVAFQPLVNVQLQLVRHFDLYILFIFN